MPKLAASLPSTPVSVTTRPLARPGCRLVFGARRIAAFEHLGRKTIPARVIAIDDLLDGEHAENLIRKEFTVSERVAIGKSMAARLGKRQGQRKDLGLQEIFPEVEPGVRTRDLAAEHAGFGNHDSTDASQRAIARTVGAAVGTVNKDLHVQNRTPDTSKPLKSKDGKTESVQNRTPWLDTPAAEMEEKARKALEVAEKRQGPSYQTCRDAGWVSRRFEMSRRRDIPWSFHQEVAVLDPQDQDVLLDECIEKKWRRGKLRQAAKRRNKAAG